MKKFLFLLVAICFACAFAPNFAFAEQTCWARIINEQTYLFAQEDCSKSVFTLEKSYYVQVLSTLQDTYFVSVMNNDESFPKITGYVKKNQVELSNETPTSPLYPTIKLTVSGNSATVRLSPLPSAEMVVTATNTQQLSYYGTIESYDKTWYYVYFAGNFGYVLQDNLTVPTISLHPTPLEKPQDTPTVVLPTETPTQNTPNQMSPTAEVILIVFVSLVAVAITLAIFLPVKEKKQMFDGDI